MTSMTRSNAEHPAGRSTRLTSAGASRSEAPAIRGARPCSWGGRFRRARVG